MRLLVLVILLSTAALALTACGKSAAPVGDPVLGEELYGTKLDDEPGRHSCAECHRLDEREIYAPTFMGIGERAGQRVEGMSATDYLRESIVDPEAHMVEGFSVRMPKVYGEILTDDQINNLIAFMLSR